MSTTTPLVACPLCGSDSGYTLQNESLKFRWWRVLCNGCGAQVAECYGDGRRVPALGFVERPPTADAAWNDAGEHAQGLRDAVRELTAERDALRAAALLALVVHQGASSLVGQPLRQALGIAKFAELTPEQFETASSLMLGR